MPGGTPHRRSTRTESHGRQAVCCYHASRVPRGKSDPCVPSPMSSGLDGAATDDLSLADYLAQMQAQRASDLFLRAGSPPAFRVDGRVVRSEFPAPTPQAMDRYRHEVLTPLARERFLA